MLHQLIAGLVLVAAGQAGAPQQASEPRFVAGIGLELTSFVDAGPLDEPGLTTTAFEIDSAGFDVTVAGEVILLPWLAVGGAYQGLSKIVRSQIFDVNGFRDFTTELRDGVFDPWVVEAYAAPFWQASPRVRISGLVGFGFWRGESRSPLVLLFDGEELSRETVVEERSGPAVVLGASMDVWPARRVGARVAYKFLKLSDLSVDESTHSLSFMALFGF